MTLSYQDMLIFFLLTAVSGAAVIVLLTQLVMFAGLRACLHCGCELNAGVKACLICGHSLKPRASEPAASPVRSSRLVPSRAAYLEPMDLVAGPPVTMAKAPSAAAV